jgi:hypothetical protein
MDPSSQTPVNESQSSLKDGSTLTVQQKITYLRRLAMELKDACRGLGDQQGCLLDMLMNNLLSGLDAVLPANSSSSAEVPAQSRSNETINLDYDKFKKHCDELRVEKSWDDLLQLLDEKTASMGDSNLAKRLQTVPVEFRKEYNSIRKEASNGLLSAEEEKKALVSLWAKVLMLVDDMYGQLKF